MRKYGIRVFCALAALAANMAWAQIASTTSLVGTVTDASGQVVSGATSRVKVASGHPHFGEEPPPIGRHGVRFHHPVVRRERGARGRDGRRVLGHHGAPRRDSVAHL